MIDIIKQTPNIYSEESRDYQLLARLYTAIFNFSKMYIDNMRVWDNNIDDKLTTLRAKTLNFNPKGEVSLKDLEGMVYSFKYLLRIKGTKKAIEYCNNALARINDLEGIIGITNIDRDKGVIEIKLPSRLVSLGIMSDLLSYLIPAGMSYRLIPYEITDTVNLTQVDVNDGHSGPTEISTANLGIYNGNETDSEHQGYTWYRTHVIGDYDEESQVEEEI